MKKFLALALAAIMLVSALFAFTACGEDTLVCGVTIFENMNEKDENGNWTGFESEFAMAVGEIIGMKVEFQEIDWEQKYNELNAGAIDCIWNGFTANSSDNINSLRVSEACRYLLNSSLSITEIGSLVGFNTPRTFNRAFIKQLGLSPSEYRKQRMPEMRAHVKRLSEE